MLRNFDGLDRRNSHGMDDVFGQMRDVVDEVVRTGEEVTGISTGATYRGSIPVDIKEEDGKEILKADLPGVDKEDINIRSNSEEIEIWGTTSEDLDSNDNYQRRERRRKTFRRTVSWPKKIDEDTLHAWFEDGVLHVEADREYSDTDVTVDGVDSHIDDGEDVHVE
jgi:HSP20 family molecular chaperone IbpA